MDEVYYRYMDFQELYSIIKNGVLRMKQPYMWPDKFENILENIFNDQNTYKTVYDRFYQNLKDTNEVDLVMSRLYYLYKTQYVCCFTTHENKDSMWRSFSYGRELVRVAFRLGELGKWTSSIDEGKVSFILSKMDYPNNINTIEDFVDLFKGTEENKYGKMLNYKRKYFEDEQEIRLIMSFALTEEVKKANKKCKQINELDKLVDLFRGVDFHTKENGIIDIPIDIEMITDVMCSPFIQSGFEWCVQKLCEESNIVYMGKSQIYDFC